MIDTIKLTAEIRADEEARRQREERYRAAEARYEAAVARREAERARMRELHRNAARYRKAEMLRQYIDALEAKASRDCPMTKEAQDWIAWARAKADWIEPFIEVSDRLLDA